MLLSVVMPAYNEAALLESSVCAVADGLRAANRRFELMIVENGSTDATRTIAQALADELAEVDVRVLPRADYGEALRTGVLESTGDVVATLDVDYFDLDFLAAALGRVERDSAPADLVVASKRAEGAHDRRPWFRRLVTFGFTRLATPRLRIPRVGHARHEGAATWRGRAAGPPLPVRRRPVRHRARAASRTSGAHGHRASGDR